MPYRNKVLLFLHQQLPHLFDSYRRYAEGLHVDSLVIMDQQQGFNSVVNRGPAAFVDFLNYVEQGLGLSIRDLLHVEPVTPPHSTTKKEDAQ